MAFPKYQTKEVLNKVLNSGETALQVDIVAGAEYAEDSEHTTEDTGNFVLGVRNDTLAELGGDDGDYVPFQMNADGALYVEISSGGANDSIYVDDADWTDSTSKHTLVGGLYQSSPQTITDGDTGPLQVNANGNLIVDLSATDNAVLDAMVVDLAALETLQTSTNTKLDTLETTLTAIETDQAAIETLLTAANVDHAANEVLLGTIDADTGAIKTAVEIIDNAISGSEMQVDIVADGAGLATAAKQDILETTLTAIETDIAANEVLLGTIDADTGAIKTAVEVIDNAISGSEMQVDIVADGAGLATDANLALMLYGTALAVTAVHGGSDHSLGATYEAFYIGVGGDVSLDCVTSGTNIVFKNLASGQMLPVRATVVNATNTTATNIVALKA